MLRYVVSRYPNLVELGISTVDRLDVTCCWNCFTESADGVMHSPMPFDYSSVESFAVRFPLPTSSLFDFLAVF